MPRQTASRQARITASPPPLTHEHHPTSPKSWWLSSLPESQFLSYCKELVVALQRGSCQSENLLIDRLEVDLKAKGAKIVESITALDHKAFQSLRRVVVTSALERPLYGPIGRWEEMRGHDLISTINSREVELSLGRDLGIPRPKTWVGPNFSTLSEAAERSPAAWYRVRKVLGEIIDQEMAVKRDWESSVTKEDAVLATPSATLSTTLSTIEARINRPPTSVPALLPPPADTYSGPRWVLPTRHHQPPPIRPVAIKTPIYRLPHPPFYQNYADGLVNETRDSDFIPATLPPPRVDNGRPFIPFHRWGGSHIPLPDISFLAHKNFLALRYSGLPRDVSDVQFWRRGSLSRYIACFYAPSTGWAVERRIISKRRFVFLVFGPKTTEWTQEDTDRMMEVDYQVDGPPSKGCRIRRELDGADDIPLFAPGYVEIRPLENEEGEISIAGHDDGEMFPDEPVDDEDEDEVHVPVEEGTRHAAAPGRVREKHGCTIM